MPNLKHILYLWHVNKNVFANCKSSFDTEETWKIFYDNWYKLLYASIEPIFEEK